MTRNGILAAGIAMALAFAPGWNVSKADCGCHHHKSSCHTTKVKCERCDGITVCPIRSEHVKRCDSTRLHVYFDRHHCHGPAMVSVSDLPAGVVWTYGPDKSSDGVETVTLKATDSAIPGSYRPTVTVTSRTGLQATETFTLIVKA